MKNCNQSQTSSRRARTLGIALPSLLCILLLFPSQQILAQSKQDRELRSVYQQMEAAGKTLRTFYAKITQKNYTAILKEFGTVETGDFYLARAKDGSTMMRRDLSSPGRNILTIKGQKAVLYRPSQKEAIETNLGKNTDKAAEFLAFGIGKPPDDLQKNYDISYQGEEAIGGVPCAVLSMKPKNPQMAKYYSLISMWVKRQTGIPIQYKLQEANNDYMLVTFSDEKLNIPIPDSKFEQNIPKNVQILHY